MRPRRVADGLKEAFDKINKDAGTKLIGYVLDLRNNPGGLLEREDEGRGVRSRVVTTTVDLNAPPASVADASVADASVAIADASGSEATATEATPPRHDRRARVAVDLSSTEPAADTTAGSQ